MTLPPNHQGQLSGNNMGDFLRGKKTLLPLQKFTIEEGIRFTVNLVTLRCIPINLFNFI